MKRLLLVAGILAIALAGPLQAQPTRTLKRDYVAWKVDPSRCVDQNLVSLNACCPTSILNSLIAGNAKMQTVYKRLDGDDAKAKLAGVIDKYGKVPSEDYGDGRERWDPNIGVSLVDTQDMFNDILAAASAGKVDGGYLDRSKSETPQQFLRRVHGKLAASLAKGVPPLISMRSFACYWDNQQDRVLWTGMSNHVVMVTGLPRKLEETDQGFAFEYLDPDKCKLASGYIYADIVRPFAAVRGNNVKFKWLSGLSPFLLVQAPSLSLGTGKQKWFFRTILTLNYGIWAAEGN